MVLFLSSCFFQKRSRCSCVSKARETMRLILLACGHHVFNFFSVPGVLRTLSQCSQELSTVHGVISISCRRTLRHRDSEIMLLLSGRARIWTQISLITFNYYLCSRAGNTFTQIPTLYRMTRWPHLNNLNSLGLSYLVIIYFVAFLMRLKRDA